MSNRVRKINELIREEASKAIAGTLDKSDFITVKAVETERDLRHAVIWVSVMGDEDAGMKHLLENKRDIESEIRSKMYSKYTPSIEFKLDHSQEYVENIEKLLHD